MECRNLEIKLISATELEDVGIPFSRTKVYATVKVEGVEHRTPIDKKGKTNPIWDFPITFFIRQSKNKETVTIKLYSHRKIWPKDRYIGMVEVPLKELHKRQAGRTLSYPVKRRDSSSVGQLNFSYRIVDTAIADDCIPSWACNLCEIIFQVTLGFIFSGSNWSPISVS